MYQDHLKTCEYCRAEAYKKNLTKHTTTKAASGNLVDKRKRLAGLASYIHGTPLPFKTPEIPTKGAAAKEVRVQHIEKVKLEMPEGLGKAGKGS